MEAISLALLRHYWIFSSSGLLDRLLLIFLLKISHRFQMGFRSGMLSGQSSTVISWSANHLEVLLAVWAGTKVLLEKKISISIKLVSRCKHKVLQNLLVDVCIDSGLEKTQWTNTSRRHGSPNHHWLQKLHTGLQAAWILFLSSLALNSRPWFPNEIQNLLSSEKRTLDHWVTIQFFFSLSQVRCFWRCVCFRSGLVALFLKMSERGDSLLQLQFTPCEALPSVWIDFAWQYSQACSHPCSLYTFSYPISSFQSTLHVICFDTALLEQPPLSVMTLCDLLSLWRVSMIVFWTIAKSAVFGIIVLSKNKRYTEFILYRWLFNETQI